MKDKTKKILLAFTIVLCSSLLISITYDLLKGTHKIIGFVITFLVMNMTYVFTLGLQEDEINGHSKK